MQFKYGGYAHSDNEVSVALQQRAEFDARMIRKVLRKTLQLEGKIHGTTQADLDAKMKLLDAAYSVDNRDAILLLDDGSTHSTHSLPLSGAYGGVRVTQPPSWGQSVKGEFTTWRTYSITLEADYLTLQEELLAFQETLSFEGTGGRRVAYIETVDTFPDKQQVNRFTVAKMVQSGQALGLTRYPSPPIPIFPLDEDEDVRNIVSTGPTVLLGVASEFGMSWKYQFRRAGRGFNALPNVR